MLNININSSMIKKINAKYETNLLLEKIFSDFLCCSLRAIPANKIIRNMIKNTPYNSLVIGIMKLQLCIFMLLLLLLQMELFKKSKEVKEANNNMIIEIMVLKNTLSSSMSPFSSKVYIIRYVAPKLITDA